MFTETNMESKNEDNLMVNTRLMKITGLYQLFDSRSYKVFGYNIYKCLSTVQMTLLILAIILFFINIYYFSGDLNIVMGHIIFLICTLFSFFPLFNMTKNSNTIWNSIHQTSIDDLSYKYHDTRILEDGRSKSKSYVTFLIIMWVNIIIFWISSPLFVTTFFLIVEIEDKIYAYRYNTLNFVYPFTDKFYNDHFMVFCGLECIPPIIWAHSIMNYDILLISMNITIEYQLKTIANSFSTFNETSNDITSKLYKIIRV